MSSAATRFELTSVWVLAAPVDRVWAALADPLSWPEWWPYVRAVETLVTGTGDGLGSIRRIDWATRLPYRIRIDVEVVEIRRHRRIRGQARGHLEGEGVWDLRPAGTGTEVRYTWRVDVARPWMRRLALVLAPLYRWNHDEIMRAGERGLRQHLAPARRSPAGMPRQPSGSATDGVDARRDPAKPPGP